MTAYYNEIDAYAAQWLRNLIAAGHIAPGDVDERDIRDVRPDDLKGYTQCHFFAGIGVWSHALRLAGWPDDRPVWTGSCPCQPFSAAGRRGGVTDERHLWPAFFHLVGECRPANLFGEQVASKDGLGWLDLVQADMEGAGYAFGASDLCVAGFGGPHIRQRLFFGAQRVEHPDDDDRSQGWVSGWPGTQRKTIDGSTGRHCAIERMVDTSGQQRREGRFAEASHAGCSTERAPPRETFGAHVATGGLADAANSTEQREITRPAIGQFPQGVGAVQTGPEQPRPTDGFWRAADWLFCRDGKWRPVRPGSFPLANRAFSRVGRLRAYGNAISPYPAKAFIENFDEACRDARRVQLEEVDVFS